MEITGHPKSSFRYVTILLISVLLLQHEANAATITIDTVSVGNAGNQADATGFGSVAYDYQIGTTEVTASQYVAFLNSVDPGATNALALYDSKMTTDPRGSIDVTPGASPGFRYLVKSGRENKPAISVSWFSAVRFANWLHNGQGNGDTETGAYTLLGGTAQPSNASSIVRNPGAKWFLPTEDEWYKAAYHKNDGVTGNYFAYPTGSDVSPTASGPTSGANFANMSNIVGNLTDVGSYINSASPYGTFDQAGNAREWTELLIGVSNRSLRGGSFFNDESFNLSSHGPGSGADPASDGNLLGFRVAAVPEPSSLLLAGMAIVGALLLGRPLKKR